MPYDKLKLPRFRSCLVFHCRTLACNFRAKQRETFRSQAATEALPPTPWDFLLVPLPVAGSVREP